MRNVTPSVAGDTLAIGVGVGIGGGILLLLAAILLTVILLRRRKRGLKPPVLPIITLVSPPQFRDLCACHRVWIGVHCSQRLKI